MTTGMPMLLALYSAVAKAENMTAGRVMFTATDLRALTPSGLRSFVRLHSTPRPRVRKTGSAVSRTWMSVSITAP